MRRNRQLAKIKHTKKFENRVVVLNDPTSEQAEYFRTLKTNIDMLKVGSMFNSLLVTSPTQDSGKTLIASNLAATYAQYGIKTLLIDLDLRKPSIGYIFPETQNKRGLSHLLDGQRKSNLLDEIVITADPNLFILPAGTRFTIPHIVLNSTAFKDLMEEIKKEFDMIVVDTPPLLAVSDALITAEMVDACTMVVKNNYTKKREMIQGDAQLAKFKDKYIGIIYNDQQQTTTAYSYYGN